MATRVTSTVLALLFLLMSHIGAHLGALLGVPLGAREAYAQKRAPSPSSSSGASGPTAQTPEARALALFDESAKSYRAGRFEEAVRLLREAYALKANPVLLYNMARAYEGMGALPEAVDAYTRYLRDESNVHDRGAIEKRLETLRKQIEEREALARRRQELEAEHARPEPKPEPPRSTSASPIPWIIAGVGVAGLGAGVVFGLMSSSRHDAAVSEPQQDAAARDQDAARTYAAASTVAFVAGSVLTAGGVAWGILDVRAARRAREASSARIVFGPGWAGVRGSF